MKSLVETVIVGTSISPTSKMYIVICGENPIIGELIEIEDNLASSSETCS